MMHSFFSYCSTLLEGTNFNNLTVFMGLGITLVLYVVSFVTKSHQLRSYVPTVWTSLGIFFTFCAIYYGLKGFDPNETDVISKLIREINKAFTTSIIGIAGAVFFAIANRVILAIQEKKNNDKFDGINWFGGIDSDTPELLLFKIISIINQKGDSIEKVLNTNQASTSRKSEDIYCKLDELLNNLNNNTNPRIEGQTGEIQAGFELVGQSVEFTNKTLNESLSIQKKDFLNAVEQMKEAFDRTITTQNGIIENKLNSLQSTLDSRIERMETTNEKLINRLIDVVDKNLANESEKRNTELHDFIEQENADIKLFIEKQERLYQEIEEGLVNVVSGIRQLFENDVKQNVEAFAKEQHELSKDTIEKFNVALVQESRECLDSHMKVVNDYLEEQKGQITSICSTFEQSVGKLPEALSNKLDELHKKENALIETTISDNQVNVERMLVENKRAIENIASGIKDDYENIKIELKKSQDNWKGQADKIEEENLAKIEAINNATKQKIQSINDAIVAFGDEIKGVFDGIKNKIEASINENTDTFGRLLKANEKAINDVAEEINGNNELLRTSLGDIKDEITKSIDEFNSNQHRIKENAINENEKLLMDIREKVKDSFPISELEASTKKLVQSIDEILNGFKLQTGSIKNNLEKVEKSINDSAEKHAEAIRNYDEKVKYIGSVIDLFKAHITDMAILQSELEKLNANPIVHELKVDAAKKQEGKQKSNKH